MTFTVLRRTDQVFCRLSLDWNSPDVFRMIRLGLCVEGGRGGVKCHVHHMASVLMLTLVTRLTQGLSAFSAVGDSLPAFPTVPFGRKSLGSPPVSGREFCYINHLEFFCKGYLPFSANYVFIISSDQCGFMDKGWFAGLWMLLILQAELKQVSDMLESKVKGYDQPRQHIKK